MSIYKKSPLWFSIILIVAYVLGSSIAESFSKLCALLFQAALTALVSGFLIKNKLLEEYGLCRPKVKAKKLLFYLPMALFCSVNLWYGFNNKLNLKDSLVFVFSMVIVGFLEEIIFRGFLFKAMAKDSLKAAVIVSSLTFGIGHFVNLFNGSGTDLLSNSLQVLYAITFGFLCVIIFIKTKSLWPCIITHSLLNSLSLFSPEKPSVFSALFLFAGALVYAIIIIKLCSKRESEL